MIKVKVEGSECNMTISGNVSDITSDVGTMISYIYNAIKERDNLKAEQFYNLLMVLLLDDDSPVWTDEGEMEGTVILSLE